MDLIVEKGIPIPKGYKSKEYEIGTELFVKLEEIGDSSFVGNINPKKLSVRLGRIGKNRDFSIIKEKEGYRVFRIS